MKAVTDPVSFLVLAFMGIIFLLLGLALFYGILKAAPEQLAFASTQRLASAIQEACITKDPIEIEFSMQQSKPFVKTFAGVPLRAFAKTKIREFGDPDFVLYYEMFPPGEGIAWEVYHDFEPRGIVTIPDGYAGKTPKDLQELLEAAKKRINEDDDNVEDPPVVISNILLTPDIDASTGSIIPESERAGAKGYFGFGEWVTPPLEGGDNIFRFINYKDLTGMEKANIKYMACGENSLCLKTPEGVFTFPLTHCDGKIKTVQFSRDKSGFKKLTNIFYETARDTPEFGAFATEAVFAGGLGYSQLPKPGRRMVVTGLKRVGSLAWENPYVLAAAATLGVTYVGFTNYVEDSYKYRTADLSFASPCSIDKATVKYTQCKANYKVDTIYYYDSESGTLQTLEDENKNVAKHYTNLEGIRGEKPTGEEEVTCIKIDFDEKTDHCYTYNLDRESAQVKVLLTVERMADPVEWVTDNLPLVGGFLGGATENLFFDNYVVEPVRQSTKYFNGIYLMKQAVPLSVIEETFNNLLSLELPVAGVGATPLDTPDEWWWP